MQVPERSALLAVLLGAALAVVGLALIVGALLGLVAGLGACLLGMGAVVLYGALELVEVKGAQS